ncbi:hypothetical protein ES705_44585 [subsurface metagenome]
MKVNGCIITSSPCFTFDRINDICKAAVPFTTATAYLLAVYSAIFFSNRLTNFPTLETNVLSIHSFRYFFSLPKNLGSCKGIKPFVLYKFCTKSTNFLNIIDVGFIPG